MTRTTRLVAAAASLGVVVLAGCGEDAKPSTPGTSQTSDPTTASTTSMTVAQPEVDPLIADLCAVLNAAAGGKLEVAKTTFDHGPLHTLADDTIDVDRSVAARLLEAKEAVEADLDADPPDGSTLVSDLEALITATANALEAIGTPSRSNCDLESP